MEEQKPVINIEKRKDDYRCPLCQRMIDVSLALPLRVELENVIYNTWDYGHQHKVFNEIRTLTDEDGNEHTVVETAHSIR
jgi:hypothetical protein